MIGIWSRVDLLTFNSWELVLYYKRRNAVARLKENIRRFIKDKLPKRRLYPNGSVFHFTYGDPTYGDWVNKWICDLWFDRPKSYIVRKEKSSRVQAVYNFFDYSIGREVDMKSYQYKEDLKRRGRVIMSESEAEQEARKNREYTQKKINEPYDKAYEQHLVNYLRSKNATPADITRAIAKNNNKN